MAVKFLFYCSVLSPGIIAGEHSHTLIDLLRTNTHLPDIQTPTAPGQIGINPVESDLGDPITYLGEIYGSDTLYITQVETGTQVSRNSKLTACD